MAFVSLVRQRLKKSSAKTDEVPPMNNAPPSAKVEALVEMGALSKAARTLASSSGPKKIDEETKEKLRQLHPASPEVEIPHAFEMHQIPGITEDEVARTVRRKLSRGAAPAQDGWTRELLIPLIDNHEALPEFTAMINDLANGITSQSVMARLMASPLIPLEKPDGGVRPIAVESAIVKLISHIALSRITETAWKKAFPGGLQFGVGPEANVEKAIRRARELLKEAPNAVLVDCTNAYNTISREAIIDRLSKNPGFSPIYRMAAWSLRHTPLIVIENGEAVLHLNSESGVRQGSVLGPLLFCMAIQPLLQKIVSTVDVRIVAYLDDVTIIGKPEATRAAGLAFTALEGEMAKLGLRVNTSKTIIIEKGEAESEPKIVKLLGAAVWLGSATPMEQVSEFVSKSIHAVRPHIRERLFLPITPPGTKCTCGKELTAQHMHSCPSLGAARIRRHDGQKKLLATFAARTYTVREEPSRLVATSRARPDLQIAMPDGALNVDVSCTYAGLQTGHATTPLEARAKEKETKYVPAFAPFAAFCVASTGELGTSAVQLLARLLPRPWERSAARAELKDALLEGNLGTPPSSPVVGVALDRLAMK